MNTELWTWLIVFFVTFGGIADAVLAWAATFRTAQAGWTAVVNRLAHSAIAFVPVSFLMWLALIIGAKEWAPWVAHPIPEKHAWLNLFAFRIRNEIALGAFWVTSLAMVNWSLRCDAKSEITRSDHHILNVRSTIALVLYVIASTIVSWDFIMSLSPSWHSTMFAPYFFCTSLYAAMGVLILMAAWTSPQPPPEKRGGTVSFLGVQQFQDMGNLMLAFALLDMGLFFAQYLTIWYGNLPEETPFLILRYARHPWAPVGWTAFALGYAIPFVLLQSRMIKRNPRMLAPVAALAVIGVALERYVMVVPSLQPDRLISSPAMALGFVVLGMAFVLVTRLFLRRYPPVSRADEVLREARAAEGEQ